MEDSCAKDQANTGRSSSKLRYPLRSATKSKEEKPPATDLLNSSVSKRGRPASSVSQSVGVLDLSAKEKSGKPPRRLSVPAKSTVSPVPKLVGNITPISEARAKSGLSSRGKNDTPVSDVSKSSSRKKFNVLSSASYWLSQIKLSESAAKHTISLGFFKLALEAGCEPVQRMKDELKSYAQRHNLAELGEPLKELFQSYNISENFEQLQVSETCSQVPEEGTRSSDDDVHSSSSSVTRKLKPKSLNAPSAPVQASPVTESAKDNTRKDIPEMRTRGSWNKASADKRSASVTAVRTTSKISQKSNKKESTKDKDNKDKRQAKKADCGQDPANPSDTDEVLQANKENMDAPQMEGISSTEV